MQYRKAAAQDLEIVLRLLLLLHSHDVPAREAERILAGPDSAVFLAFDADAAVGFANCSLRRDYVEGTGSSPVGYLEGIYVLPEYRNRGIARALAALCEDWARARGCAEFASDCELDNTDSLAFHLRIGFDEVNRIICFAKKL